MWKNLTKSQLDAAYNNSKAVANSSVIIQTWQQTSAEVKNRLALKKDIAYGATSFPALDFYLADVNAPTVAFVHGGFWQMRSKDDFAFIVPTLLEKKINVAMLGYRLAPAVNMHQIVADVQSGINTSLTLMHDIGLSQQKLWLVGWSAGAHLAVMQMNHPKVAGITAISGIYDLEPMRFCYVNDLLQLDEITANANSPILLAQHPSTPVDIFVGGDELPEMQKQSSDFAEYRNQLGAPGSFQTLPGTNHYTVLEELTQPTGKILDSVLKRMKQAFPSLP